MKKIFAIVFVLSFSIQLKAIDTLTIVKNKKIGIGIFTSPISYTGWSNTKPYVIDNGSFIPFFIKFFVQNGINIDWNFYKYFYLESGANIDHENISELADNLNFSPLGQYNRTVWLNYDVKYLQIPLSISYISTKKVGFYFSIGLKNNFIYHENLYGIIKAVPYDTTSNQLKFNNITATFNLGGNVYFLENRLRCAYFFSMNSNPIYQEKNGITNFSFYKFGSNNIALFYNINL